MKNNLLRVVLFVAILFAGTSCVKDSVDEVVQSGSLKRGSITLASTRLSFDGSNILWEGGEKLGVSFENLGTEVSNLEGTVVFEDGVTKVKFEYPESVDLVGASFVLYHPYSTENDGLESWNGKLKFNVSPRQTQPASGINIASLPLLSASTVYGSGTPVTLYHLGSIIKFNVYGNATEVVKNVSISTDGYGGVFSSGAAKVTFTAAASTESVDKDEAVELSRSAEGDAFAAQCSYKGDNNGVDVTLASPANAGASREAGVVAYAITYPFTTGDRAKNAYIAVTTDKALYTWTRNLTAARGKGLVLNLNLATADESYSIKTYTNTNKSGRLGGLAAEAYPEQNNYTKGDRTWMTTNLRWAGYDDALGLAHTDTNNAELYGRQYGYYAAASTLTTTSGSGWTETSKYTRSNMVLDNKAAVDEMGLKLTTRAFSYGYDANGSAYNGGVSSIRVHHDPNSDYGKTMRAQFQFNCPKGWHLPSYIDTYHLLMAVSDTYTRGTSWSNGEPGWNGSFGDLKDPFYNCAVATVEDPATTQAGNAGYDAGSLGPVANWLKASDNKLNGGLWTNYTTKDAEKGWLDAQNRPMFATTECYTYVNSIKGTCKPSTYLVNGTRDDVAFNAYPAGYTDTNGANGVGSYSTLMTAGSYILYKVNGGFSVLQFQYDQGGYRSIIKVRNNMSYKCSVRCVKNYEHYNAASQESVSAVGIDGMGETWDELTF